MQIKNCKIIRIKKYNVYCIFGIRNAFLHILMKILLISINNHQKCNKIYTLLFAFYNLHYINIVYDHYKYSFMVIFYYHFYFILNMNLNLFYSRYLTILTYIQIQQLKKYLVKRYVNYLVLLFNF